MRFAYLALLAAVVVPVRAQPAYTWYELIPPSGLAGRFPLFDRAFTSGRFITGVATDRAGNVYMADRSTIHKITPDGMMAPLTGFGPATLVPGDRIPALLTSATLFSGAAGDSKGNVYLGASGALARIATDGTIEQVSSLNPSGIAVDGADNVYILVESKRVVRIAPGGATQTIADLGDSFASEVAADPSGNVWFADVLGKTIRKIEPNGNIASVADTPNGVVAMAADSDGNLYFTNFSASAVMRLSPTGEIQTVAGSQYSAPYHGDGAPAVNAFLSDINGLAVDASGAIYISMFQRLSKVGTDGILHTVAGCACGGEGVPSDWAQVGSAAGLVRDSSGNTYFSDQSSHVIRRISPDGIITTVAGTGESGFSGDGGPARDARLSWPAGLALDSAGAIYVADEQNNRIRKFTPGGSIETVAGNGNAAFSGDGGPATSAALGLPDGVAVDPAGNIYIADTASHRIRKVTADGVIRTIAGLDQYGTAGDGGPAIQALLINPRGIAIDLVGNVLFTDSSARLVRRITPAGIMERVAGNGQQGTSGDGGPATAAPLELPWGITVDAVGTIFFGDGGRTRYIDAAGVIHSITFPGAAGLAVDDAGRVWIATPGTSSTVGVASQAGPPFSLPPVITNATISAATGSEFPYPPEATSVVAPGEIVAISAVNATGNTADTVRVFVDGVPAPMLSWQFFQATAIVPFGIAGKTSAAISIDVNGRRSNEQRVAVLPAVPAPFLYSYGILNAFAALNQDGKPNAIENPATRGSVISLFATGAGTMTPLPADGQIVSGNALPAPVLPVAVTIGTRRLDVLWAGAAPGLVAGVVQVNVRLPSDLTPSEIPFVQTGAFPLELRVGNAKSRTANVWVSN